MAEHCQGKRWNLSLNTSLWKRSKTFDARLFSLRRSPRVKIGSRRPLGPIGNGHLLRRMNQLSHDRLIIVIPCYNEDRRLPIEEFRSFADKSPETRFLMVDDGSRDGTLGILRQLENQRPASFEAISLERNFCKAEAVRRGMLKALRRAHSPSDTGTPISPPLSGRSSVPGSAQNRRDAHRLSIKG